MAAGELLGLALGLISLPPVEQKGQVQGVAGNLDIKQSTGCKCKVMLLIP